MLRFLADEDFDHRILLIVEVIARVTSDDSVPRVYEALEDALETIEIQSVNVEEP